jgi:glycosyltransferase involved in cell wall biosynthesis
MRILHLITRMDVGGSSEDTLQLLLHFQPDLSGALLSGPSDDPLSDLAIRLRTAGIPWQISPHLVRPIDPICDLRALGDFTRRIRALAPALVHTHTSKAGFVGRVAAHLAGVRAIVHTPHGHVFSGYADPTTSALFIRLERFAARFTTKIVVLTTAERDQHLAAGVGRPAQYVEIPSGVDLAAVRREGKAGAAVREQLGLTPETPVVGTVARLVPIKGLTHLITAFRTVLAACPAAHLVLAGDGEERGRLEAQARDLGLAARVHFLGFRADPAAVTAALDVFALPSLNEGQARALIAAMALGIPPVGSAVGGIPDVIAHGVNGLLVPAGEATPLAAALTALLQDSVRRRTLGAAARHTATHFSADTMYARHAALYQALLPAQTDQRRTAA